MAKFSPDKPLFNTYKAIKSDQCVPVYENNRGTHEINLN